MTGLHSTMRPTAAAWCFATLAVLALVLPASGAQPSPVVPPLSLRTVRGSGIVNGRTITVEWLVGLKPGADAQAAVARLQAMARAHGVPVSPDFVAAGHLFPQFLDGTRRNDAVTQHYNPAGDPTSGGGLAAVRRAQATWNRVKGTTATTRCPSLSFDCPAPSAPDGFNDIGWRSIGFDTAEFVIFAYVSTDVDLTTGEAFEADLLLNSDIAPFLWFTDGLQHVDVETVVLHELGHVAGLAHTLESSTVMAPAIHEVRRALTDGDEDGLRFLYPKHPSILAGDDRSRDFSLVAEIFSEAPGGGLLLGIFEPGGVNARGDVAFVASVPKGQALLVRRKEELVELVRSGQVADGILLGVGAAESVSINDAGEVAFSWLPQSPASPFGTGATLFRADDSGAIEALVVPGVTPAPGGGRFRGSIGASISDRGHVAFDGLVDGPGGVEIGIFVARSDGGIQAVARPGGPAPGGGRFATVSNAAIGNGRGDVAFQARLEDGSVGLIYAYRAHRRRLERIVGPGDVATDGSVILFTRGPKVNRKGDVLFAGAVQILPAGSAASWTLFLAADGAIRPVVRFGQRLPDGLDFETLISFTPRAWSLNDDGDAAFIASGVTSTDLFGSPISVALTGVYATERGRLRYVTHDSAVILGAGQMLSVSSPLAAAIISDAGEVVFNVQTLADRRMLLKSGPSVFTP
jgi:hypothetical protein